MWTHPPTAGSVRWSLAIGTFNARSRAFTRPNDSLDNQGASPLSFRAMPTFSARHRRLIQLSIFVLMLLSIVVRPIVIQQGELHTAEHDIASTAEHGDSHAPGNGENVDPKHASGVHSVLHQADVSFAGLLVSSKLNLATVPPASLLPGLYSVDEPSGHRGSPFRPPIV